MDQFVIGVDYGTDSVRALIVNAQTGEECASSVFAYPRWKKGLFCDPATNRFRQHPLDYTEGLLETVREALAKCPAGTAEKVMALSVDTTGSTPVAVNRAGIPLSLLPEFENNPDAMFVLWKDHTAIKEAEQINELSRSWGGVDYTRYEGGIYSSEWFWAKVLHVIRQDAKVASAAFSWVEHCDWIPALLTGNQDPLQLKRSRCAAGHKAMWHPDWNGLPSEDFLSRLDPLLKGLRERLYEKTYTSDVAAGNLSKEWADKLGLSEKVVIGVGAFDAHLGAVGGEIKPYYLSKVMGTSTCDMLIAPAEAVGNTLVRGICGQVDGSITPGFVGLEAGQSAFGDVYAWFSKLMLWPVNEVIAKSKLLNDQQKEKLIEETTKNILQELSDAAALIPPGESGVLALDWLNGRRTPDANQKLKGAITGLTLGTDAPRIFKALVEATAFGARAINERFIAEGVRIDGVIALGGVAKKSSFVMQTVCNVLNKPILVARSEQACALGTAMAASVAAGIHPGIPEAQVKMGNGFEMEYTPERDKAAIYDELYADYCRLGAFVEEQA
ncbi:MAG: ribulokinase [Bacteroidales bacterium]